jgi:hypothetical protein
MEFNVQTKDKHSTIEYQTIYSDVDYQPILFLLCILFLILYFIAIYKQIN